jgi:hypothetical protein
MWFMQDVDGHKPLSQAVAAKTMNILKTHPAPKQGPQNR